MSADDRVTERSREFTALGGRRVEAWVGVEMAVRERTEGRGAQFGDPAVPCLQLLGVQASLDGGGSLTVGTYQDADMFGLSPRFAFDPRLHDERLWTGLYRCRPLTELPTGRVEDVAVFADGGVLAEVSLRIAGRPLLLVAGEVAETPDGGLVFGRWGESVLVFTVPAAARDVPWVPSRSGLKS